MKANKEHLYMNLITGVLFSVFAFSITVAVTPSLRTKIKDSFYTSQRKVLSTAHGKLFDGRPISVVKVSTAKGLFIEVYDATDEHIRPLIDRIELPDLKDGFILFQGQAINLAIKDINNDNNFEIIAPSFDQNLVAHMNVFAFNKITEKFELMNKN